MRRLASVVLTGVLLSACGGVTGPEGVLVLRTINGAGLPVILRTGLSNQRHVISGTLELNGDNTYRVTTDWQREDASGIYPQPLGVASGTYIITGSTIEFIDSRFSSDTPQFRYTGTVQGDQVTSNCGPFGVTPPIGELALVYGRSAPVNGGVALDTLPRRNC